MGRVLFAGSVPDFLTATGESTVSGAFRAITGVRDPAGGCVMTFNATAAGATRGGTRGETARRSCRAATWLERLSRLPRRHRLARGAALSASARALLLSARAAADLAVHFRGRFPAGAWRLDHSAVRVLRALRGVHRARACRHDPAVQRHAVVAVDGLRPRDGRHADAARQPVPALVPAACRN